MQSSATHHLFFKCWKWQLSRQCTEQCTAHTVYSTVQSKVQYIICQVLESLSGLNRSAGENWEGAAGGRGVRALTRWTNDIELNMIWYR